jgi:hypothetical protein
MGEQQPVYVSRVRIVRDRGPIRRAYLPVEPAPVVFGTHGEVREHYGTAPGQYPDHFGTHGEVREHYGTAPGQYPDHATTLDYVVAAAAG